VLVWNSFYFLQCKKLRSECRQIAAIRRQSLRPQPDDVVRAYLIDLKNAVIMDVEATRAVRQAEVSAAKTMLDHTAEQFDLTPSQLVADAGYGSAEMIESLVDERGIEPHGKLIEKAERTDGTFSRSDFAFDPESNLYVCPGQRAKEISPPSHATG
jgi:hypothetical protein